MDGRTVAVDRTQDIATTRYDAMSVNGLRTSSIVFISFVLLGHPER